MLKIGDKVKLNSNFYVADVKTPDKVYTVRTEPKKLYGAWTVELEGVYGTFIVDGLVLVEECPEATKPKIPTWKDWQRETFPNADAIIEPCMFASREEIGCDGSCRTCCLKPIPQEYITKLGIEL